MDNLDKMPYHILPDAAIVAIARDCPTTGEELSSIEGVGRTRVGKYGKAIISIITQYLAKNNLTLTTRPESARKRKRKTSRLSISGPPPATVRTK